MASQIESLPAELPAKIATYLGFSDLASLRLTSRAVLRKAGQWAMNVYFHHKTVKLEVEQLKRFVEITNQGGRGCLVRHLILAGIAPEDDHYRTAPETRELEKLLQRAFENLKQWSPEKGLASLTLRVVLPEQLSLDDLDWATQSCLRSAVWLAAQDTFKFVMKALVPTVLPVTEHLDLFGARQGCSVGCHSFDEYFSRPVMLQMFGSLKKLTVSLSAAEDGRPAHEILPIELAEGPKWYTSRWAQYVMQAVLAMPELTTLDVHWYKTTHPLPDIGRQIATPEELYDFMDADPLPHLQQCTLRGVATTENCLLFFVSAFRPVSVTLLDVDLLDGDYLPMFNYLTMASSPVRSFHLDDLRIRHQLLHFEAEGAPKFPYQHGSPGPSTLTRVGYETKWDITSYTQNSRPKDCAEWRSWGKSKIKEYGPLLSDQA